MAAEPDGESGAEFDKRIAKAVGHPLRIGIMRILSERIASPSELAEALGEGVSHVSYHVQELCKYGCVELVDTEPSRGAIEHFYRAAIPRSADPFLVDDEEAKELSTSERVAIYAATLQVVIGETVEAHRSGTLHSRHNSHTSLLLMDLDETGWSDVTGILLRALEEIEAARSAAAGRLEGGTEGFPALVSMLAFERGERP